MPSKESILAIEGYGADGVFDRIGVHLDPAIGKEDLQASPVPVDVAELFAEAGFGRGREDQKTIWGIVFPNDAALMAQPLAEVGDQSADYS